MPEIGLGIGTEVGSHEGSPPQPWLYWYDQEGNRFPAPESIIAIERQQRVAAEQQLAEERRLREELLESLRLRGINPDEL